MPEPRPAAMLPGQDRFRHQDIGESDHQRICKANNAHAGGVHARDRRAADSRREPVSDVSLHLHGYSAHKQPFPQRPSLLERGSHVRHANRKFRPRMSTAIWQSAMRMLRQERRMRSGRTCARLPPASPVRKAELLPRPNPGEGPDPCRGCAKANRRAKSRVSANGTIPAMAQVITTISGPAPHSRKPNAATVSTNMLPAENRMLRVRDAPARSAGVPSG